MRDVQICPISIGSRYQLGGRSVQGAVHQSIDSLSASRPSEGVFGETMAQSCLEIRNTSSFGMSTHELAGPRAGTQPFTVGRIDPSRPECTYYLNPMSSFGKGIRFFDYSRIGRRLPRSNQANSSHFALPAMNPYQRS